jgi:hypothetical protein
MLIRTMSVDCLAVLIIASAPVLPLLTSFSVARFPLSAPFRPRFALVAMVVGLPWLPWLLEGFLEAHKCEFSFFQRFFA